MSEFRERLNFAMKQIGVNQAEFARQMGTESQNVNLWKVRGGIPRAHFIKACDILRVNAAWLSEGKPDHEHSGSVKDTPGNYNKPPNLSALNNLISAASPKTIKLLEQIKQADISGKLTDADIDLLETITRRLSEHQNSTHR